jgi:hypothetical protein
MPMTLTPMLATGKKLGLLRALAERLQNYGVGGDVRLIAAVLLETVRELDWAYDPEGANAWLAQLALEMGKTGPVRIGPMPQERTSTADLLPHAEW